MSILSNDGKYVTVEKGDSLWAIAAKHLGDGTKYKQLASINNIPNSNLIHPGQKIYLTKDGSSSSSKKNASSNTVQDIVFGLQSDAENTLYVTWSWSKHDETEHYKVDWKYTTTDGIKMISETTTTYRYSTFSIPSNAVKVTVEIRPIAKKTKSSNGKETTPWTAKYTKVDSKTTYNVDGVAALTPGAPDVEIEKFKLTATYDDLDTKATQIEFKVVKDNKTVVATAKVDIKYPLKGAAGFASHSFTVDAGGKYKVCARAIKNGVKSEWSPYSTEVGTAPAAPKEITVVRATAEKAIYLEWTAAPLADTYDIEYATKITHFDGTDQTTTLNGIKFNHHEISGLAIGTDYFFRVRAVNEDGESSWTAPKSVTLGMKPAAPTTWSSTTTAIIGEPLTLYWVHNTRDGSSQTLADLMLTINGVTIQPTFTIENLTSEEEKDKTRSCTIDTTNGVLKWVEDDGEHQASLGVSFVEGVKIEWQVKTAGVTKVYGEYSVPREIDIYAPPTLQLNVTDKDSNVIETLTTFPFYIYALAGPNSQVPLGYNVTMTSNQTYETVDNIGNPVVISAGDEVYSRYFDISDRLLLEMSAGNIDLENNITYTITVTVSMNSGLTTSASSEITVGWDEVSYIPNAEIVFDSETYVANIRPYCEETYAAYHKITYANDTYTTTSEELGGVYGDPVSGAITTTGEQVYLGTSDEGEEVYYCTVITSEPVTDVLLSVYRREFDGSFTEIGSSIDPSKYTYVTDPHPALDYARYRIVATSQTTGAVGYYDPPGHPIGGKAAIIQWAEDWVQFDSKEGVELEQPPWSGSLLAIPYNIDVSDSNKPDVEVIEYIGREHPVVYYGTQLGSSSTWSMEIPADDVETLYGLRRLSKWMGDVYVREPSGTGYWAHVTVSYNLKHKAVTVPVTLAVTRVEGGA